MKDSEIKRREAQIQKQTDKEIADRKAFLMRQYQEVKEGKV